jgi:tetratricopeptide (TPR) repeat protein
MKATQRLHDLGQSLWLDNITRDLLASGTLQGYIDELSVTGLTSNPTIFDHAIKSSTAYDAAIRKKVGEGKSGEALFFELAIEDLTRLVAAQPRLVEGYVLLGAAHLMKKEPARALEIYRKLAAIAPKDPRGPYFVGIGLLATGKRDEARKSFQDALTLAPVYVEPLVQLVQLDLTEKKPEAAVSRIQRQIAAVPTSGPLQHLLGVTGKDRL